MASGHSITRRGRWPPCSPTACGSLPPEGAAAPAARRSRFRGPGLGRKSGWLLVTTFFIAACANAASAETTLDAKNPAPGPSCKPVYLTLDTGHMEVAPLIADVLKRHHVKVTFFAANERTKTGDGSLGTHWAPWWKARAAEGHEFASHTFDHTYWRADVPGASGAPTQFSVRPSAGPSEGKTFTWTARQYCEEISRASARLQDISAPLGRRVSVAPIACLRISISSLSKHGRRSMPHWLRGPSTIATIGSIWRRARLPGLTTERTPTGTASSAPRR